MNYILWIQDIVYAHKNLGFVSRENEVIRGIDVGTGSTAIYPFLACKMESSWEMVGTELDNFSYESALKNVEENGMQDRIFVRKATVHGTILFPLQEEESFDFTMCNPPFYASAEEIQQSADEKELPPNGACTGAEIEMIYEDGGEAGFVSRMVNESQIFRTKCKWYTSMLGKMSSVSTVVQKLKENNITNYALTEFVQGQTRRWAVAWSFTNDRLADSLAHISSISLSNNTKHPLYGFLPQKNTLMHTFVDAAAANVEAALQETLNSMVDVYISIVPSVTSLKGEVTAYQHSHDQKVFIVAARENTWSRSARRRGKKRKVDEFDERTESSLLFHSSPSPSITIPTVEDRLHATPVHPQLEPLLQCSCRVLPFPPSSSSTNNDSSSVCFPSKHSHSKLSSNFVPGSDHTKVGPGCQLEFQWIKGTDHNLFESFVGHVGRKVSTAIRSAEAQ